MVLATWPRGRAHKQLYVIAVGPETALKCLEPAQLHPGLLWPSAVPSSRESVFVWQSRSEDVHISSSSPCCIAFQFWLWSQIWNWWDRMSRHLAFLLFAAASISLASGLSWPQWPPAQVLFENDIAGKTIFCPSLWFHPIKDNEHTAQDRTLPGVELDPEADWNAALTKNVARLTLLTSQ